MKKILIVEDDANISEGLKEALEFNLKDKAFEIIIAPSVDEARKQFKLNPDIALITFDGSIEGDGEKPNTRILVEEFKQKGFSGPMIAASSMEDYSKILCDAGCTHVCKKFDIPEKVVDILCIKNK
jgi:DNA-binding response OmpR family regulator